MLAAQRDRWLLWVPVASIAGAAAWLGAPADPPAWLGLALMLGGAAAATAFVFLPSAIHAGWTGVVRNVGASVCVLIAAAGIGAGAGEMRTQSVAQTPFAASDEPRVVEGWVWSVEPSERGPRLRLLTSSVEGVASPPRFVRVSVPAAGMLTPGRAARCRAILGPPQAAMAPGAYDFSRRAFFEQLGASGFAYGRCRPIDTPLPLNWLDRQQLRLAAMRSDLSLAIQAAAPGRGGAIAAALVTGDRSAIDQNTNEALQNSGLGHLLSVSGIHMSVVGGMTFAAFLWSLSFIGPLALRWPVKKLAAIGALVVLAAYLLISGSSVPALRSFVMAAVAFGAILLDRPAISMRGLALAALIVVCLFPESVLEPGFQMSFAATMALVALFEMLKRAPHEPELPTPGPLIGALQWSARGIGGVIGVSVVAGLATDPFAIYHFQRFSIYALPSNLVAAPITTFLVAPAAGAAAILAPFGLADAPLELMASALDLIAAVGDAFGSRAEAVRALPKPPDFAFALVVFSLVWAALWRGALRWGAAPIFIAGVALYALAPQPIAAFDSDFDALYARANEGSRAHWTLMTSPTRSTYAKDRLGSMLGLSPPAIERLAPPENCNTGVCTWRTPAGHTLSLWYGEGAAACTQLVLAPRTAEAIIKTACPNTHIIDSANIAAHGGGLIYEDATSLSLTRAWTTNVRRPWTPRLSEEVAQE